MKSDYYLLQSEADPVGLILEANKQPFVYARIILFGQGQTGFLAMSEQLREHPPYAHAEVPGYNIFLKYEGSLMYGSKVVMGKTNMEQIQASLKEMVKFYYAFKIERKPRFYNKYKY